MLQLLMFVLILGVIAYVVQKLNIASPFKEVAWGILVIILIVLLFRAIPNISL